MNDDIKKAVEVLKNGGVILYPTDTIWGIGCDATNPEAVKKVYDIKKREDAKSMLVLLDNINSIDYYVEEVPEIAYDLIEFSEKPVTVIFPNAKRLAKNLINEDGTIGIRVTNEKFSNSLISRFRNPIVSTSANISGQPSPSNFNQISEEIKNSVDYIVNFRQDDNSKAKPSSIIKLGVSGEIKILRE
jgi:L-threonylcarbamoyladenylate synthase